MHPGEIHDVIMDDDAANAHILFPGYPGRGVGFLDNEIDLSEEDTRHEFLTTPCYHDHCNNNRSNSAPNDEQEDSDIFNPRTENFDLGSVEDFGEFKSGWSSTSSHIGSTSGSPFGTASRSHKLDGDGFSDNFEIDWPATWSSDASDCDICVIDVCLELKYLETLFGFSVLGGCDEDNRPVIEHIDAGSPADRAELEIGDEILEVNGKNLESSSHEDIISFIHSCIKTKCIRLRVKRKPKGRKVGPEISLVKDAYIIAVEDEARKRLEKISSRHRVVAVDMTKLSRGNSISSSSSATSTSRPEILVDCHQLAVENPAFQPSMPSSSHQQHVGNGHIERSVDMNGFAEMDTPRKGKKKDSKRSSKSSNNSSLDSPLIETISGHNVLKRRSQNSLNRSQDNVRDFEDSTSDVCMQNSFDVEYDDTGPHREMAIDCPDDFPASAKSPPRYPPPPHSQSSSTHSLPRAPPSTPAKALDLANNRPSTDNTLEYVSNSISNGHQNMSDEQVERIRKHQEELRKRRDEENRRAREEDFLRTSLRGSKKLQALEASKKQVPVVGVVNTAYEENDDEVEVLDDGFGSARGSSQREKYMKKNIGLDELFSSLHHIQTKLTAAEERDELSFLKNLFHTPEFQNAVQIHSKITDISLRSESFKPKCTNAVQISNEVLQALQYTQSSCASDLIDMLNQPGLRNLLRAHDNVAEQVTKPTVHENVDDSPEYPITQYGEETVRIVYLEKTNEPLGATVRNDGEAIIIGRVVKGGTAEKSGLLHEGDEILEVNGVEMRGKNINDVSDMLADMTGTITFMVIPSSNFAKPQPSNELPVSQIHVKALCDYDPEDDILIPCRELGISFMKGDILHVINQEDPNWWQAYREGEEEHQSLAGLIPSRHFKQQVESSKKTLAVENKENQKKGRSCSCGKKEKKKKKKSLYREADDNEEILTYDEVVQYYPQPNRKRPIVLVGPPNVGRHELRQRLMETDLDRFAAAVPHTSRPQESHEVDSKDYHFVPRAIFEADIIGRKFIEHGEYQKALYGTTFGAVRQVINQGKICILNLHAETLRELNTSDLKPYVILVYPQNMEKLRQIQQRLGQTKITDEDLKDTVDRAREMEDRYGHLVDFILVNSDMDLAYEELLKEINRIEVEPQWVPAHWIDK